MATDQENIHEETERNQKKLKKKKNFCHKTLFLAEGVYSLDEV